MCQWPVCPQKLTGTLWYDMADVCPMFVCLLTTVIVCLHKSQVQYHYVLFAENCVSVSSVSKEGCTFLQLGSPGVSILLLLCLLLRSQVYQSI